MRVVSHQSGHGEWFARPTTPEGRWAVAFTLVCFALGILGEVARREEMSGPFYPAAFAAAILGGVAAVVAVRKGERSLLALIAFLPLLIGLSFGLAELLG